MNRKEMAGRLVRADNHARLRSIAPVLALAVGAFVLLLWLSIAQLLAYNNISFDLSRMSQSIWHTTQGRLLLYTTKGVPLSRLAEHVEIIFILLSPLYALWSSPVSLLIVQAGLFAAGAWPVYRISRRRLKREDVALALAATYLFYPVAQTAVLFEFHGDTLAMPLLLFALDSLDRGAWRSYGLWLGLALLCKVYVAVPVFFMGLALWLRGEQRIGLATTLAAVLWGAFAFFIVRSLFAPQSGADVVKATAGSYLAFYFGQLTAVVRTWSLRLVHAAIVLVPALLLGVRAWWWLLVAASVIAPVLLSDGPGPVYAYKYHHYALAVPFIIMALIEGAQRLQQRAAGEEIGGWRRAVFFTLGITLLLNIVAVDTPLNPRFYLSSAGSGMGLTSRGYLVQPRDAFKDAWLENTVPQDAAIVTDRTLGQRLSNRPILYLSRPQFSAFQTVLESSDYVAVDGLYDFALGTDSRLVEGGVSTEHETIAATLRAPGWHLQEAQDGLLLFSRGRNGLRQEATLESLSDDVQLTARFSDAIGLLNAQVVSLGERRFRYEAEWMALQALSDGAPLIAVSRPGDLPFSRIVHLPTLGLLPTSQWPIDAVVREVFEFELPEDTPPGTYPLSVGWYRTDSIYSPETDERARVGGEVHIATLEVP